MVTLNTLDKLITVAYSLTLDLHELYLDCCEAIVVSLDEEINKGMLEVFTEEDLKHVKNFEGYFVREDNPGTLLVYRDRYYDQRVFKYWYPPHTDKVHPTKPFCLKTNKTEHSFHH